MKRVAPVETGAPELWPFVLQLIDDCVTAGYLKETPAFTPVPVAGDYS